MITLIFTYICISSNCSCCHLNQRVTQLRIEILSYRQLLLVGIFSEFTCFVICTIYIGYLWWCTHILTCSCGWKHYLKLLLRNYHRFYGVNYTSLIVLNSVKCLWLKEVVVALRDEYKVSCCKSREFQLKKHKLDVQLISSK